MEEEETAVPAEEIPEVAEETTPEETPELTSEQIADLQEKAKVSSQNFERAKKAEAELKEAREKLSSSTENANRSTADILALVNAKVHEDDMQRVEKYAADEKLSIKDALASDELKAILEVRNEKRATAAAANVTTVRRGATKVSDETLVANASAGKLPDSDEDIERLIAAKARQK